MAGMFAPFTTCMAPFLFILLLIIVGVIYAEFIILDGQSAAGSAAGLVMGVGIILGGQMAGDTGTWPNSNWSPSKLAKVAAWEQAQFEAARKKANRRTLRSQFHKMTHRRTTSTSSSNCPASDAALQPP